jgi:hypothetical protein
MRFTGNRERGSLPRRPREARDGIRLDVASDNAIAAAALAR